VRRLADALTKRLHAPGVTPGNDINLGARLLVVTQLSRSSTIKPACLSRVPAADRCHVDDFSVDQFHPLPLFEDASFGHAVVIVDIQFVARGALQKIEDCGHPCLPCRALRLTKLPKKPGFSPYF